jgi:hypothetical protein
MTLRATIYLIFLFALTGLAAPAAANVELVLRADRSQAFESDIIELVLEMSTTGLTLAGQPSLFGMENFRLVSTRSSTQFNIIGTSTQFSRTFVYLLAPKETGAFTIGPATLQSRGATFRSNTLTITVEKDPDISGRDMGPLYAKTKVSHQRGFVGQEILYTLAVYSSIPVDTIRVRLPQADGLTLEELKGTERRATTREGTLYTIAETVWSMTFDRPGVYELGPSRMEVPVLVQTRQGAVRDMRTLFSEPVTITIGDFPQEGRPAGFSGLVGKFSLEASLSDNTLSVGDSTTLSIRFSGIGNVRHMPDPEFAPVEGIRSYAGAVQFSRTPSMEGTQGVKSVEWALVPQEPGNFVIEPKAIAFFNPDSMAYELAEFVPLTLTVKPAAHALPGPATDSAGEAGTSVRRVELLAQDIQTINESPRFRQGFLSGPGLLLVLVVLLLPPLVFMTPILVARHLANNRSLEGITASRKALSLFLKQARSLPQQQAEALQKALLAYLAARLGLPGGSLTPDEASAIVMQAGADAKDASTLKNILERLDACIFGCKDENFSGQEREELLALVKRLDKAMRALL